MNDSIAYLVDAPSSLDVPGTYQRQTVPWRTRRGQLRVVEVLREDGIEQEMRWDGWFLPVANIVDLDGFAGAVGWEAVSE